MQPVPGVDQQIEGSRRHLRALENEGVIGLHVGHGATFEGMAVDVFTTASQVGFPIRVLTDYTDEMNRYALLMID